MSRAYLLIVIPALVVGGFYLAIFHSLGMPVGWAPFLGTAVAFGAALLLVRRYQQRRVRRSGR
jgi:nitrate reductase gamma subunit